MQQRIGLAALAEGRSKIWQAAGSQTPEEKQEAGTVPKWPVSGQVIGAMRGVFARAGFGVGMRWHALALFVWSVIVACVP